MLPDFLVERLGERGAKVATGLGLVLVLGLVLLLAYCTGRGDGRAGEQLGQQVRENKVQAKVGAAGEAASQARVQDAVRAEQQTKELTDAIKATDDPDRQRALRGCVILRQQGRDTSRIAACGGPAGRP